jgi:hypothetical protein
MNNLANRSTFPQQVDTFTELYDLPPNLVAKAKRYQALKIQPTLTASEQAELNSITTELEGYIISPEVFNKMNDAITNVETFFLNEVDGYIDGKQLEWSSYVNAFKLAGAYSTTTQYKFQNMVTYNGDLYLCTKDAKGVTPTNTANWQKISAKGDKGDVGLGLAYKGNYDATKAYALGDAVTYNGSIYYAKVATTAGQAPTDATKWMLFDKIYVGATAPSNAQQGVTWIQEV